MSVKDNEVINLNTDEEVKKVLDLLGLTGDTGGTATAGTAMAKLNELLNGLDVGVTAKTIRHIQRGTAYFYISKDGPSEEKITLKGFTNSDKMIVLLDGSLNYSSQTASPLIFLSSLTTEMLTIEASFNFFGEYSTGGDISYQVIEFY